MERPDECEKCGRVCITKDDRLRGPLVGSFEWLCPKCAIQEEAIHWPLKYKEEDKASN